MEKVKEKICLKYNNLLNFFAKTLALSDTKEGFARYFNNTGYLFFLRVTEMVVYFFIGAYVARYLGPAKLGLLSYAASLTGLFAIFTNLGIDSILSRELVAHPEKKEVLLGSGFLIKTIGSFFSISLIVILLFILKADWLTNFLILISASCFIFNAFSVINIYFKSQVAAKNIVKVQIVTLIIISIMRLIFIFLELELIYFALVYLIDAFIVAIGLIYIYKKTSFSFSKWKIDKKIVWMLLKNSWPLILSSAAIMIYMKIDQVMIKNMIDNEAVGLYSVAARISEVWYFLPAIICSSLFPAIINSRKTNQNFYKKRLLKLYSLMFYLSVSIAVIVSLFANLIINLLFGADYIGSIAVLKVHIWAGIGVFWGYAVTQYLMAENYVKIFFIITLAGAISNVILNLLLIPKYGIIGSAIATLISYSIATFGIIFFKKSRYQVFLMFKSINIFSK